MHKFKKSAALLAIASIMGAGVLAGCSDDKGASDTPAGADTIANTAVQTDDQGNTVTSAPANGETTDTTDTAGDTPSGDEPESGDAEAGKTFFEGTCQGCHPNDGQDAGAGPVLAGKGLDQAAIDTIVSDGRGAMPPGLAQGEDKDNVVAFVLSIQ